MGTEAGREKPCTPGPDRTRRTPGQEGSRAGSKLGVRAPTLLALLTRAALVKVLSGAKGCPAWLACHP